MVKTLAKSIREYKRDSILTPILVSLEVLLEVIRPAKAVEQHREAVPEQ